MDDLSDFFSVPTTTDDNTPLVEEQVETTETVTETPEPATEETTLETASTETPEVETPTSEDRTGNPNWVPVSALTAQRNKARENEQEVERLRNELARYQQVTPAQTAPVYQTPVQPQTLAEQGIPDPVDDPQGFYQHTLNAARQEMQTQHVQHSRQRAVAKYGADLVNDVATWAVAHNQQNPAFEREMLMQPDPAEWVIEQKKRFDLTNSFVADPDAYVRARAAELGFVAVAPVAPAATTTPALKNTGPASLVTAKSNTEAVDLKQAAKDTFDAIFKR